MSIFRYKTTLRRKCDVVTKYIEDFKPLIITISEIWLDPDFSTSHLQIDSFSITSNDRGLKNKNKNRYMQAGGVVCYIHRSLMFLVLEIASSSASSASKLLLAVVYRHEDNHVLTEFFNVIDQLAQS